ncbi:hypothetical protein WG915_04195 [Corynebacterium sp. H128]|uniref:hypothetical protein n=1 Tax=Corynebacterium sp. H128 TaxID=3133427 RepID=UPI00309C5472
MRYPPAREQYDQAGVALNGLALAQQLAGSEFITELYSQPVTRPGISYLNIATQYDQIVLPYSNSYVDEPGVDNRLIQDYCPGRRTNHLTATYDPVVADMVLEQLTGIPRAVDCSVATPIG